MALVLPPRQTVERVIRAMVAEYGLDPDDPGAYEDELVAEAIEWRDRAEQGEPKFVRMWPDWWAQFERFYGGA